jgi:hypothetical protein
MSGQGMEKALQSQCLKKFFNRMKGPHRVLHQLPFHMAFRGAAHQFIRYSLYLLHVSFIGIESHASGSVGLLSGATGRV